MKKSGGFNYLLLIGILISVFTIIFLYANSYEITGNAISTIDFPSGCTEDNIKNTWDLIFKINSSETRYYESIDKKFCGLFKNISDDFYFVYFSVDDIQLNITTLYGLHTTTMPESRWIPENITNSSTYLSAIFILGFNNSLTTDRNIPSIQNAKTISENIFFINDEIWNYTSSALDGKNYYYTGDNIFHFNNVNNDEIIYLNQNETLDTYQKALYNSSCATNWTMQETACSLNEIKTSYYSDINNCGKNTNQPANITVFCDYDSNGIIGNKSSLDSENNFSILISGIALNDSLNYSTKNTNQPIEIKKNGSTIISFRHNFTSYPLDLKNTTIKLNNANSTFGYIIVNGINDTKTVYFDKKNSSSNQVCIKDNAISTISDISDDCDHDDEYLINCPGDSDGYSCTITNNTFKITGLEHSAIREIISTTCSTNWSCSTWSNCTNLVKSRTCTDINNCDTTSEKPALTEACVPTEVLKSCVSNWTCTNWSTCTDGFQIRTCTDKNNCNTKTNKPQEKQECTKKNYLLWILILFGIIILIVIIILVIKMFSDKQPPATQPPIQNQQPPQPPFQQQMQIPQERQIPIPPIVQPYPTQPRPIQQYPFTTNNNPQN